MGPLPDHVTTSRNTPDLRPSAAWKDRGVRPGPAGAPSIDSAVESWEDSSADTQRTRSSAGRWSLMSRPLQWITWQGVNLLRFSHVAEIFRCSLTPRFEVARQRESDTVFLVRRFSC